MIEGPLVVVSLLLHTGDVDTAGTHVPGSRNFRSQDVAVAHHHPSQVEIPVAQLNMDIDERLE